jgi:hypothetical protein
MLREEVGGLGGGGKRVVIFVGIEIKKEGYCLGWKVLKINKCSGRHCLIYFEFKAKMEENSGLKKHAVEYGLTTKA